MTIKIYHQVGHNTNWNVESYETDKCGDGLILSPVHQSMTNIEKLSDDLKTHSIFDPQYYLPNSQKKKLSTYPFFPEVISNGFSTVDFHLVAHDSAVQCIDFQIKNQFKKIIIPTRFIGQMKTDYFKLQEEYSVKPFLKVINSKAIEQPIFITLALTSHMIEDEGFRTNILNWVTSFSEIAGVYILVSHERDTKQIQSAEYLKSYLDFLHILRSVELEVIVGHSNTEALIYSLIQDITVSFGTFENTRIFSIDKFVESDAERRGPKARIYMPKLLNWIQFSQAQDIRNSNLALWDDLYVGTDYSNQALNLAVEPTFNQAPLYKHHFVCMADQIKRLNALDDSGRVELVKSWINDARVNYAKIRAIGIDIENHGNGNHLDAWEGAVNHYSTNYLLP